MSFFSTLAEHLNLVPAISTAVQEFQSIGHSKETTLQKIQGIVDASAQVGEQVPVPVVQGVSALVQTIVDAVFGPPPTTPPANP
jgi:hypothetical protein